MKIFFSILSLVIFITITGCSQGTNVKEGLALKYLIQMPTLKSANIPVVIMMHGYGSNEKDLFSLQKYVPKNFLVLSVRAPYPLQEGHGYEWYEMTQTNGHHSGKKEDLDHSRALITTFIGEIIKKYKADPKQIYLMGFSQGAMMSYYVGLAYPDKVKGIAPLSGMIMASLKPEIKNTPALKKLKIFISNGTIDERIPFADGKASYDYLLTLGLNPEFHEYEGMGHQISNDVITDFVKWLGK